MAIVPFSVKFQSTLPARGATPARTAPGRDCRISIHAPRTGSDLCSAVHRANAILDFNPRSPHGERPRRKWISKEAFGISIHAPRTGSDGQRAVRELHVVLFQSTLPARGATLRELHGVFGADISIHAPRTGSDSTHLGRGRGEMISIHAPRTGSDSPCSARPSRQTDFNPRSPHGERLIRLGGRRGGGGHFNPRSPHGERLRGRDAPTRAVVISIHAPRTGSDADARLPVIQLDISIHAPRTGSDLMASCVSAFATEFQSTLPARGATEAMDYVEYLTVFQSTLPARGATIPYADALRNMTNFNPRSPHGERRVRRAVSGDGDVISIHAPRTGSDTLWQILQADTPEFQSTLPARGATVLHPASVKFVRISIHAPRTGSDRGGGDDVGRVAAISIHAPRTGSDADCPARTPAAMPFQSTLPARGATGLVNSPGCLAGISIHAPRTGSDTLSPQLHHAQRFHFNPRSPHGERRTGLMVEEMALLFQSTLPARGATATAARTTVRAMYFNPRSPHGERRRKCQSMVYS